MICSTCFGHYYTHHQELTAIMSITTLVVSFLGWISVRSVGYSLQPGHYSSLTAPNFNLQQTKNETTNVVINIIVARS